VNIVFQYPTYFILFCLLTAAAYAAALYVKDRRFGEATRWLNPLLMGLRFLAVFIICLLLLEPVMRNRVVEQKKPIVVLAQDQSSSLADEVDSAKYAAQIRALQEKLGADYELETYAFGQEVRPGIDFNFSDPSSNLSALMQELSALYGNQDLATVILASDGIYNQGNNPIYAAGQLNTPIYTIALGDSLPKKDLYIKEVYNNQIAYLGDKFSVQLDVAANNCAGQLSRLELRQGQRILYQENINIKEKDFFQTIEFELPADKVGLQSYELNLSPVEGEYSKSNNSKKIYIEVLDARQKILLLAHSPHPDLGVFRRVVEGNKNYELELAYPKDFKGRLKDYDLVLLHQLPSAIYPITAQLNTLKKDKIPHTFVVGAQTDLAAYNQAQNLLSIRALGNGQANEVTPIAAPNFRAFTLNEKWADIGAQLPPMQAPFGEFTARGDADVLFKQRVGTVSTDYPLLLFGEEGNLRQGVLAAEGLWKWRIFDYVQHKNFDLFDELISQTIQYLSVKADKRRFRAMASQSVYGENERIRFAAELYNSSYERVNEPDAFLNIYDDEGKEFNFTLAKNDKQAYALDAGIFPEGNYRFKANTSYNGESFTAEGQFSVQALQLERFETQARHDLLYAMSEQTGGKLYFSDQLDQLAAEIDQKGLAKPVLFDSLKTQGLIHLKWIFFLILGLLSLEWFLRRYYGSY